MAKERAWEKIISFIEEKGDWLALVGAGLYAVQLFIYAHASYSRLDESAYLYKGFLFATGQYEPFGFGIWTNKAPLSFLIPGYVEAWFGPGLRTGRYLAIFFAMLMLLGAWLTARRLGNKSWGAAVVWFFTVSISLIIVYSLAISQVLVACMLTWTLALSLGGDRKLWQLMLSAVIAALMLLTRQNMVMVFPILLLYIFWQYGFKKGSWASLAGIVVVIIGHAIWWPQILQLWDPWLPSKLAAFLKSFYIPEISSGQTLDLGSGEGGFSPGLHTRVLAFFRTFRYHLPVFMGLIVSLFLWSPQKQSSIKRKDSIFLLILFAILAGMHAWASLGQNYCVYCWSLYFSFFNISAVFFILITFPSWKKKLPVLLLPFVLILFVALTTGMGYAAFEEIGESLFQLSVPRIKNLHIQPGSTELGILFVNKFDLSQKEMREYLSILLGVGVGLAYFVVFFIIHFISLRKKNINITYASLIGFFGLSLLLFPLITTSERAFIWHDDVILAHEEAGSYLADYIAPGSSVYWMGGTSMIPLMYIPDGVNIYPPQLNLYNNYRIGGDDQSILARGYWNNTLDQKWKKESEYIVIVNYLYTGEWNDFLSPQKYEEFPSSSVLLDDREDSYLRVFRKR